MSGNSSGGLGILAAESRASIDLQLPTEPLAQAEGERFCMASFRARNDGPLTLTGTGGKSL